MGRFVPAIALATGTLVAVGGALAPSAGATSSVSKTVKFNLHCSLGILGNYIFSASLSGTYPASVKPGQKFFAKGVHGYIIVPKTLDQTSATYGQSYEADLKPINASSSDAKPGVINGAGKGIIVKGEIPKNTSFKLNIPQHGDIRVGPWTAGKKGTDTVTFGGGKESAGGTDTVYCGKNQTGFNTTVTITCGQPANVVLAKISVS
jgi:hypothetical protein